MNLWDYEQSCLKRGLDPVCGVDEVGVGPLAGPTCAAAVILPIGLDLPHLNDSKKVTPRRREQLYEQITQQAVSWSVAWASEKEIDEMNILNARILAMQRAIDGLKIQPALALIDGNRDHGNRCKLTSTHELIVKGDNLSASIAAASIVAKVSRDRLMVEMDQKYPGYGFAKHKGYPTKAHYAALDELGPCPIHRESYLVKWRNKQK